jgi:hypothetical protein
MRKQGLFIFVSMLYVYTVSGSDRAKVIDGLTQDTRAFMRGDTAAFAAYLLAPEDLEGVHHPAIHPESVDVHDPVIDPACLHGAHLESRSLGVPVLRKYETGHGIDILHAQDCACIDWYLKILDQRKVSGIQSCKEKFKQLFKKKCDHDTVSDLETKYANYQNALPTKKLLDEIGIHLTARFDTHDTRKRLYGLVYDFAHFALRMKIAGDKDIEPFSEIAAVFWVLQAFALEGMHYVSIKKHFDPDRPLSEGDTHKLYDFIAVWAQLELFKECYKKI